MNRSCKDGFSSGHALKPLMSCLIAIGAIVAAVPAGAETTLGTMTYATDTTWTAAESPYLLAGNVTVGAGVTLTIEPGVTIRCSGYAGLVVRGRLTAIGTQTEPILFTKESADSNPWDGINFEGTPDNPISGSVLQHVIVEGGGKLGAGVLIQHADITIRESTIRDSRPVTSDGIRAAAGARLVLAVTTLTGNGQYPLNLENGGVHHSLSGISSFGNGIEAIRVGGGTMDGNRRWENLGLPYIVTADLEVAAGTILKIDPGVMLKFAGYVGLFVKGTLLAVGTAAAPITFTRDAPLSDPWDGITIAGTDDFPNVGSLLNHVIIEGGGKLGANLIIANATASVSDALIRSSSTDLIRVRGPAGTVIEHSMLVDVADGYYALRNDGTALVLAPHVWWGQHVG